MANILSVEKQKLCLKMLVEGNSIRGTERTVGVHRDTICRLAIKFGEGCQKLLDTEIRNVDARHLEIDEQWTFVGKKQAKCSEAEKAAGFGDAYLFVAFNQDTNLIAAHKIGKRTEETTRHFLADLATRIILPQSTNAPLEFKPQFSTDGWNAYPGAISSMFGSLVQHGVIIKSYSDPQSGRYAPPSLAGTDRRAMQLVQDLMSICTSHVERFNCTTRHFVKRFTRLTLAFSKTMAGLEAAVAMHIANYNFVWRSREKDSNKLQLTPAMQSGITSTLWTFEDLYSAAM